MTDVFDVLERGMAGPMERRRFLKFTGALAGAAAFCQLRGDLAQATTPLPGYPFTLGVASGDPERSGAVLWTRLAPDIFSPVSYVAGGRSHRLTRSVYASESDSWTSWRLWGSPGSKTG
jgi:phosphodiesterase/alkaline phosphatase D-like protein